MTKEKFLENKNINKSQEKKKETGLGFKAATWLAKEWKKSAILAGAGAISLSSFANTKDINKVADDNYLNNKNQTVNTEDTIKVKDHYILKDGKMVLVQSDRFNVRPEKKDTAATNLKQEQKKEDKINVNKKTKSNFSKKTTKNTIFSKPEMVIEQNYTLDPSHGDLSQKTENKKAEVEWNIFNSFTSLQTAIQKEGKNNLFYSPNQVGPQSPYWNKKQGTETINSQQDYINHINKDLIPQGFSGNTFSNIQHFGFKLNKNEFISDSKHDVIVKAGVVGGEAYVLLKKGTPVVFERQIDSQGRPCNVLAYILDCMNPIHANDPHTNVDGSGGFKL